MTTKARNHDPKPATVAAAAQQMRPAPAPTAPDDPPGASDDLSAEEEAALDREMQRLQSVDAPPPSTDALPEWALVPDDLVIPPGRTVAVLRFRASWTDTPHKGDRQCLLWNLSVNDEKAALRRMRGEPLRTLEEMSKAMIRAVDGQKADWSGKPGAADVNTWWNDIGSRCRQMVKNYYAKTHALDPEEQMDFFANCIAVRTSRS